MEARHSPGGAPARLQEHRLQTAGCRQHEAVGKSARRGSCRKSVPEIKAHSGCRAAREGYHCRGFSSCFPAGTALLRWGAAGLHLQPESRGNAPCLGGSHCGTHAAATAVPAAFGPDKGRLRPLWRRKDGSARSVPCFWSPAPRGRLPPSPCPPRTLPSSEVRRARQRSAQPSCRRLRSAAPRYRRRPAGLPCPAALPAPLRHSSCWFLYCVYIVSFSTSDYLTSREFESGAGYEMESYMLEINGKALILE